MATVMRLFLKRKLSYYYHGNNEQRVIENIRLLFFCEGVICGKIKQINKSEFVCEKPINKRMLMCIACGNGSFEYRIELSKTRR